MAVRKRYLQDVCMASRTHPTTTVCPFFTVVVGRVVYRVLTQERFHAFHKLHPEIYDEFKRIAYDLYASRGDSKERFGCAFVFTVMRYHHIITSKPWVKVAGNFQTRYAGLLVAEDKKFSDFFVWWVMQEEKRDGAH